MKRIFILFIIVFSSISGFAQKSKCNQGELIFASQNAGIEQNFMHVKNEELSSFETLQKLFCNKYISEDFSIKPINENDLEITHLGMSTTVKMSIDMLKSKANFSFCVEEFTDKLTFFFLNGGSEIIFNSNNGIPFLTFTRIE